MKIYRDSDVHIALCVGYARLVLNEIVDRTICCGGKTIYLCFTSRISTVTFSRTGSVMLFVWFGDLLDFSETAEAFPLLVRLPRRDPPCDPGDRDFLAKVSHAFAWQRGSTTRKARITLSMKTCAKETLVRAK